MNKDGKDGYTKDDMYRDQLIAEVLLRITALENLLIMKKIILDSEIQDQIKLLSAKIADLVGGNPIPLIGTIEEDTNELQEDIQDNIAESEFKQVFEEYALTTRKISKGN